jgi:hypothetical protein
MTKPLWLKKWMGMQMMCNFYPCMAGIACFVLLLILPDNVLSLHPWLKHFTDFMGKLVPSIQPFAKHMQPHEPGLLVLALSWAMLPLWLRHYMFKEFFLVSNDNLRKGFLAAFTQSPRGVLGVVDKGTKLFLPLCGGLLIWAVWSDYLFNRKELLFGSIPLLGIRGYTGSTQILDNPFSIAIWGFFCTQAFLGFLFLFVVSLRVSPLYIKAYLKFLFGKNKE